MATTETTRAAVSAQEAFVTTPVWLVDTDSGLAAVAGAVARATQVAVDTETEYRKALEVDGIPGRLRVVSVGVRYSDGTEEAFVIDARDVSTAALADVLSGVDAWGWNANFDERVLANAGVPLRSWYCIQLADAMLRLGRSGSGFYRNLAGACRAELGIEIEGKGGVQLSYDLTSDLTAEQVRYAGLDTIATLGIGAWVTERIAADDLTEAAELVMGARPFINAMMVNGVAFDLDGYLAKEIAAAQRDVDRHLARLAELTEVAPPAPTQGDLFAPSGSGVNLFADEPAAESVPVRPAWNPASKPQLIEALNRYSPDEVRAYTGGRLLEASDSLVKDVLLRIGGPVVEALLAYKAAVKKTTTYGDALAKYWRDGRFFSRYRQAAVATGRLASHSFNAQNMSKGMLAHMKAPEGRVLVYGDISQAELRFLAHLAGDARMAEQLASEDFHAETAQAMNPDLDLAELAVSDPARFAALRGDAKAINFGIPYGMGPGLLAEKRIARGQETTREEAQGLLDAYFEARPAVRDWLFARDHFVTRTADHPGPVDWKATLRLFEAQESSKKARDAFRRENRRHPTGAELARLVQPEEVLRERLAERYGMRPDEVVDAELETVWAEQAAELDWAWRYLDAVVLRPDGSPVGFHSATVSGRLRHFDVPLDHREKFKGLLTAAVLRMATSDKDAGVAFRDEFAARRGLDLMPGPIRRQDWMTARVRAADVFKGLNRPLKYRMVTEAIDRFGFATVVRTVLVPALRDTIRGMRNEYRNHPIQGSVADVVELAFGKLYTELPAGALPVLSVHDSLVVECDEADAETVARLVSESVNGSMRHYCPSVTPKTDVDVRRSLSSKDVIAVWDGEKLVEP